MTKYDCLTFCHNYRLIYLNINATQSVWRVPKRFKQNECTWFLKSYSEHRASVFTKCVMNKQQFNAREIIM